MEMNLGIIGCGSIARYRHAPEYRANPHVGTIVFYDRNPERAEALAAEFGGRVAATLEELLGDPSIAAISDCSSNEVHHIHSSQALLSGKHVLCEKPLANSVEHAEMILEAERVSGKKLMVGHYQRFTKAHRKAKEILASGELGEILSFRTAFGHHGPEAWGVTKSNDTWFFKRDRSYSGVAGDLGIHKIDLLHYLLEDEITKVHAFHGALDKVDGNGLPIEVCDNVVCALKTKRGRLGTAFFSWTYYGKEDNSTVISCQQGVLKIHYQPDAQLIVEGRDGSVTKFDLDEIQTNENQTNSGVIDAFIDCIIHDQKPPVTAEEAIVSLRVVEKILGSSAMSLRR